MNLLVSGRISIGASKAAIDILLASAILLGGCALSPSGSSDITSSLSVPGMSGFQAEILSDSVVTRAEYERSFDATISCMRDQGLVIRGPLDQNAGRYLGYVVRLGSSAGSADEPPAAAVLIQETCVDTYLMHVSHAWSMQQIPEGNDAENVRRAYIACLREAGFDLSDRASVESFETERDFVSNPDAQPCIEKYSTNIFLFSD